MAVVVQRLVAAEVAGVLFTANPQSGTRAEMLVEASWGLGEAVVSGRVQPDVLRLDANTGRVLDATIADKRVRITSEHHEERPVEEHRRRAACLRSADVDRLWKFGRRAAEYFGSPQDIEWAIDGAGELYLLQSRPITTLAEAEAYEELLRTTRAELRERLAAGRGPWVLHNLAETLPHPTPLTWSVIRRFMTGDGGFGRMYRSVGFEPSEPARRDGFLDVVAGRVYMDASRGPEMFFAGFPFRYDLEHLRRDPDAGQAPPTVPAGIIGARMRLGRRLAAVNARLREVAADFDLRLRDQFIPAFVEWCRQEKRRDLSELSSAELIELWHARERRVLDEFAPDSLLPSLISGMALADLRAFLDANFWDDDPDALAQLLSSAAAPDRTAQSDALLYEVARGERPLSDWIAEYGHRAAGEFDLGALRWREQPEQVAAMAARLRDGIDPAERHRTHAESVKSRLETLRAQLAPADRAELDRLLAVLWRYVPFREDGKYYLMLGYELLRDVALEAGRRLEVGEDVFLLTLEDLLGRPAGRLRAAPPDRPAQGRPPGRSQGFRPARDRRRGGRDARRAAAPGAGRRETTRPSPSRPAPRPDPRGSSARRRKRGTSAAATSSSAPRPTRPGRRCSSTPRGWSSSAAARSPTARSSPARWACRRSSCRMRRGSSPTAKRFAWTGGAGRSAEMAMSPLP